MSAQGTGPAAREPTHARQEETVQPAMAGNSFGAGAVVVNQSFYGATDGPTVREAGRSGVLDALRQAGL